MLKETGVIVLAGDGKLGKRSSWKPLDICLLRLAREKRRYYHSPGNYDINAK